MASNNPFFSKADEVDDMAFLKSKPSNYVLDSAGNSSYKSRADVEYARRQALIDEKKRLEESTLKSAKASLSLVIESEKVGLSTADELVRQGEKLTNIDANLDSMNSTMRQTQKHLNSMKSIFGGLKSYFGGSTDVPPNRSGGASMPKSTSMTNSLSSSRPGGYHSRLNETIENVTRQSNTRNAIDDDDFFSKGKAKGPVKSDFDRQLDANLGELDLGLGRLKNLAIGLGSEIEQQNELLDKITTKEERAEETLSHQNRVMKNILRK